MMYLFFPTLAIYGRNPDLNLTACVSQIRSVLCIQAISQGHRQILPTPRPMRMPESNVFRSQAFGIPGAAFFALQHDPKRTRDLLRRGAFASNGHGFVTGKPPFGSQCRTSSQSFNTIGTPRSATDLGGGFCVLDIITSIWCLVHNPKMIIIECFLIIDTKRCPCSVIALFL